MKRKDNFFDRIEAYLRRRETLFLWLGLCLAFVFSILLFSLKMNESGDDSNYVLRAYNLLVRGDYPGFQGPLYPMVLSAVISLFGTKIFILKILSLLFVLASFYFLYKAFQNHVPPLIAVPATILVAINSYVLFFSSQTFSEALYLLLQVLLFYLLMQNIDKRDFQFRRDCKAFLLIGFVLLLGFITRGVHLAAIAAVLFFFLIYGQWRSALASLFSFGLFYGLWEIVKRIAWGESAAQIAGQGSMLMQKNPYNAQDGMETFGGYIERLIGNSNYYFSQALYSIAGFRDMEKAAPSALLTILIYVIAIVGLIYLYKKNRAITFTILYVGAMCLATFISLQVFWSQWRLIAVFYPFILLIILSVFYYLSKRFKWIQYLYLLFVAVLFMTTISDTVTKSKKNAPVIQSNLSGDTFAGYDPLWKSFMQMSQWAAKNVPEDVKIMSRKAEMSFIYTGREFFPMYNVQEVTIDSLRSMLRPEMVVFGLDPTKLSQQEFFPQISTDVLCFVQENNQLIGVYQMDRQKSTVIMPKLQESIDIDLDVVNSIERKVSANVKMNFIDPELLVRQLTDNNVQYVILNSPYLFGTFHRLLTYIQLKYPQSLKMVHSIGQAEASTSLIQFTPY